MKNLKYILTAFVLFAIATTGVNAQTAASDNVGAVANVVAALNITVVDSVSFGNVETNGPTITIGADGATGNVNAPATGIINRGEITITGTGNAGIDITYDEGATLSDGTNTVAMDVEVSDDGTTVTNTGTSGTNTISSALSSGTLTFYIGGIIDFSTVGTAGVYATSNSGGDDIAITVDYN